MEEYRTDDVESELGLDRDALIRMALLLGRCIAEWLQFALRVNQSTSSTMAATAIC